MGALRLTYAKNYRPLKVIRGNFYLQKNRDAERYQFGFNGQLKDNEIYGEGNAYDFGARIYDPRALRWSAVDPLLYKYPNLSPYNFAGNNPVLFVDPDGEVIIVYSKNADGKTVKVKIKNSDQIKNLKDGNGKFARKTHEALTYLQQVPSGANLINDAIYSRKTIRIREQKQSKRLSNEDLDPSGVYSNGYITWDPNTAYKVTSTDEFENSSTQSPALNLAEGLYSAFEQLGGNYDKILGEKKSSISAKAKVNGSIGNGGGFSYETPNLVPNKKIKAKDHDAIDDVRLRARAYRNVIAKDLNNKYGTTVEDLVPNTKKDFGESRHKSNYYKSKGVTDRTPSEK